MLSSESPSSATTVPTVVPFSFTLNVAPLVKAGAALSSGAV